MKRWNILSANELTRLVSHDDDDKENAKSSSLPVFLTALLKASTIDKRPTDEKTGMCIEGEALTASRLEVEEMYFGDAAGIEILLRQIYYA